MIIVRRLERPFARAAWYRCAPRMFASFAIWLASAFSASSAVMTAAA
jgi:hypothetical protein